MNRPDAARNFVVSKQLCFSLYSASRAITSRYRRGLDELGITYSQYVVLLVLWEEGATPMATLCAQLHLDSGTLSPLLKRLEHQGLVVRRRRAEDERSVEITTTEAGEALYARAAAVQADVERATGLSAPELAAMRDDLTALAERLRADETREEEAG